MQLTTLLLLLPLVLVTVSLTGPGCSNPPPASNFSLTQYLGIWY